MQRFTMAPHRGASGAPTNPGGSPNAALLIDFDNVTMGIRSDLTRQLKELLNSDIIKGKVAVQRAYADWRRYAQYIVPLSEASVDLIFAPAYGSSKKNATDIRLAIDALELVFTRPEIGTFILLSGDSDFSSLVLKLKEYGKYVIGVGLRESASDLLVQNCDEYYSYSSLTGLTRAGEEDSVGAVDAWELAERAVNQMASDDDVMRSDRLKQVMLELDPAFDEGQLGFSKFNKFLAEAASRNRLALRKLENGQYEVQPYDQAETETREERSRGRGRRDRKEEPRAREGRVQAAPEARDRGAAVRQETPAREAEPGAPQPERPAARGERQGARPAARPVARERRAEGLDHGYDLLRQAIRALTERPGEPARDSDIKRKMLELESGWDEAALGFTKFSRFLRQAHDAEVIDVARHSDGFYEARLPGAPGRAEPAPRRERERGRDRDRDRVQADEESRKGRERPPRKDRAAAAAEPVAEPTEEDAAVTPEPEEEPVEASAAAETTAAEPVAEPAAEPTREEVKPAEPATAPAAEPPSAVPSRTVGFGRRGRKGAGAQGPPPLLPGQVVGGQGPAAPSREATVDRESRDAPAAAEAEAPTGPLAEAPAPEPHTDPMTGDAPGGPGEPASSDGVGPEAGPPAASVIDPATLGLPTDHGAVIRYLSNSYQGVGQKTAEALIEAFGADRVFNGLNDEPDRVRQILGAGRRTDALLNAWQRDYRRRTAAGNAGDSVEAAAQSSSG